MVRNVSNNSWYCVNNVFKGLYMSSKWLINFILPDELSKKERLKNAIEDFNNRNLNKINVYGREIKKISNK